MMQEKRNRVLCEVVRRSSPAQHGLLIDRRGTRGLCHCCCYCCLRPCRNVIIEEYYLLSRYGLSQDVVQALRSSRAYQVSNRAPASGHLPSGVQTSAKRSQKSLVSSLAPTLSISRYSICGTSRTASTTWPWLLHTPYIIPIHAEHSYSMNI